MRLDARRCALVTGLTIAVALPIGQEQAAADPPSGPGHECRAGNAAGEAILSQVSAAVVPHLGLHHLPSNVHVTTPGVSVAVVQPNSWLPWAASVAIVNCGVTTLDGTDVTSSGTVYELGSETKTFTATALARLHLDGTLSLDDTSQSHLPEGVVAPDKTCSGSDTSAITLRELGTHNAGLLDDPKNTTWPADTNPQGHAEYTRTDLYDAFVAHLPHPCDALLTTPGTAYSYSNWGFALLGTIMADLYAPNPGGIPNFGKLVGDLVTGPLEMTSTVVEPIPPIAGIATPVCTAPVISPCAWNNVNAFAGGGGFVSTISDMATFTAANLGFDKKPNVWPALELTHQAMGYGPACETTEPYCQGLAWSITKPGIPSSRSVFPMLDKDGGTWGSHTHTYLLPDACWGITFLSNSDSPDPVGLNGFGGELITELAPTTSRCASFGSS